MAEIWFYSGPDERANEEELDELPFADCIRLLDLKEDKYLGEDPTQVPSPQARVSSHQPYVVVAVEASEARALGWRPGYYPSPLAPAEVFERLGLDRKRL